MATRTEISPQDAGTLEARSDYLAVVGFDGSEASERALHSAERFIRGRLGSLVVVFVARAPGAAAMSPSATSEIRSALDAQAEQLASVIPTLLGEERRWRFERREAR